MQRKHTRRRIRIWSFLAFATASLALASSASAMYSTNDGGAPSAVPAPGLVLAPGNLHVTAPRVSQTVKGWDVKVPPAVAHASAASKPSGVSGVGLATAAALLLVVALTAAGLVLIARNRDRLAPSH